MAGFSEQVRRELLGIMPEKACCLQSELNALTQGYGVIVLRGAGRFQVRYRLPDSDTARMVFLLLKRRLNMTPTISFHLETRLRKRRLIDLTISEYDAKRLLLTLHMLDPQSNRLMLHHVPRGTWTRRCCRHAYLRGLFIARGHMRDPERAYLVEYALDSGERVQTLTQLLRRCGLTPRERRRGAEYMVCIERGDEMTDLLALMGAHQALFALEDVRIRRAAGGTANRQTNCDTANTARQLSAAARQYDVLDAYARAYGLAELPPRLAELARARLARPEASLPAAGEQGHGFPALSAAAGHRAGSRRTHTGGASE